MRIADPTPRPILSRMMIGQFLFITFCSIWLSGCSKPQAAENQKAAPAAKAEPPGVPHRPEDYIAPGGVSGKFIRDMEMRPRANVTDQQRGKPKPVKKQAKPAMPFIAQAPGVATPKPKKTKPTEEPAAQKPDFKLTGDMLKCDAPLRRQYERHIEDRAREEKATALLAKAQEMEAANKPGQAKIYYRMAARHASAGLKQQIAERMAALK